jgi:pentatricopeptide repeat protein
MENFTNDRIIKFLEDLQRQDNEEQVVPNDIEEKNSEAELSNTECKRISEYADSAVEPAYQTKLKEAFEKQPDYKAEHKKKKISPVYSVLIDLPESTFNDADLMAIKDICVEHGRISDFVQVLNERNQEAYLPLVYLALDISKVVDYETSLFVTADYLTKHGGKVQVIYKLLESTLVDDITALFPLFSLVLRKLFKKNEIQNGIQLLKFMMVHSLEVSTCAINLIIDTLCKMEKLEEANSYFIKLCTYKPTRIFQAAKDYQFTKLNLSSGVSIITYGTFIKCLCKANTINLAVMYYNMLLANNDLQDEVIFNLLIDGFSKIGDLEGIKQVYCDMVRCTISPTIVTFNTIIDAYVRAKDLVSAWGIYDDLLKNKIEPDNFTFSTLFRGIRLPSHMPYLVKSFKILENLKSGGQTIDTILVNVILDSCICLKEDKLIVDFFGKVTNDYYAPLKPDIITYNTFIKACAQMGLFNNAVEAFNDMLTKVTPNDVTFNTMIDVCVRNHNMTEVWSIIEKMKDYGIKPDNFTYSTIIKGLNKDGCDSNKGESELSLAFKLFENVKKFAKPDEILYNCIMDACLRFGEYNKMMEVYEEMCEFQVKPSSITCGIIIKAYGMNGMLDKALEVYQNMKLNNIPLSSVTYGCLMNACIKNDNLKKAFELYQEIKENNIEMNTVLYTTLIKAYSKNRNLRQVIDVFNSMKRDKDNPPNNITYNSVIDCCIKNNELERAEEMFREMTTSNLKPDIITFSTIIKGCLKLSELSTAINYLYSMKNCEIKPDEVLLNSFLDGCDKLQNYNKAIEIYQYILSFGVEPSMMSYSIMMKVYGKLGDFKSSKALMEEVKKKAKNISLIIFTCYMKTCLTTRNPEEAINTYNLFKKYGLAPDNVTFLTLIKGLLICKCPDYIVKIVKDSLEMKINLNKGIYTDVVKALKGDRQRQVANILSQYNIDVDVNIKPQKTESNYEYLIDNYKYTNKKPTLKETFKRDKFETPSANNQLKEKGTYYKTALNFNADGPTPSNQKYSIKVTPVEQKVASGYKRYNQALFDGEKENKKVLTNEDQKTKKVYRF